MESSLLRAGVAAAAAALSLKPGEEPTPKKEELNTDIPSVKVKAEAEESHF